MNKGPPGKGEARTLALAALFSVAAKDFLEISEALQQIYEGKTVTGGAGTALGKRTRTKRKSKKKSLYWTNRELDLIEEKLVEHFENDGTVDNLNADQIQKELSLRSKADVEKQLQIYRRATNDFTDLSECKHQSKERNVPVKETKKEANKTDEDSMDVDTEPPKKKRRKSSTSNKEAGEPKKVKEEISSQESPRTPKSSKKSRKRSRTHSSSKKE